MLRAAVLFAALTLPGIAVAQEEAGPGDPPQRIRSVTLTGNETCPQASSPDEVVVCSRINPDEQYRIPPQMRDTGPIPSQRQSWAARNQTAEQVGRTAAGIPNTCSPVGTGGQTGCAQQLLRDYAAERRAIREAEAEVPN